jgi:hypothetical protein
MDITNTTCTNCNHPHESHSTLGVFKRRYKCRHNSNLPTIIIDYIHDSFTDENVLSTTNSTTVITHTHGGVCDRGCGLCCCPECLHNNNQIDPVGNSNSESQPIITSPSKKQNVGCLSVLCYMICCWLRRK